MELLWEFYTAHAVWTWLGLGALILAVEVATGTGELLWPAASAVPVALYAATPFSPGLPAELAVFAVLTIASTLAARRFIKKPVVEGPDVNDPLRHLVGARGHVVGSLDADRGRVFVGGKEWEAQLEGEARLADGAPVEVLGAADAVTLRVKAG